MRVRGGSGLATSYIPLPDYRTERLVNQLDEYGFTGLQSVSHWVNASTFRTLA